MEEKKIIAAIIMAGLASNVVYQGYSSTQLAWLAVDGADKLYEIFENREKDGKK